MKPAIGCIGLGLLGDALAERLLESGYSLSGFDLSAARLREFATHGGQPQSHWSEVVRQAQVLILSLPDGTVVDQVLQEMAAELKPPLAIIDTTTGDPQGAQARGEKLALMNVAYLDATVAGSSELARKGEAILLVGSREGDYLRMKPVFDTLAKSHFLLGAWGAGSKMKLVHNLALGLHRAVLAEALTLARGLGIQQELALEVLMASPAASAAMPTKGFKMIRREFTPQARLKQHLKDVHLILEAGARSGIALPLSDLHRKILDQLVKAGFGDFDNAAIIEAWNQSASKGN